MTVCWWRSVFWQLTQHSVPYNMYFWPNREIKAMFTLNWIAYNFHGATKSYLVQYEQQRPGAAQVQPVNKLSYVGERNEPRENARASGENARASGEAARGLAFPLARLLFTISPNLRACSQASTSRSHTSKHRADAVARFRPSLSNIHFRLLNSKEL